MLVRATNIQAPQNPKLFQWQCVDEHQLLSILMVNVGLRWGSNSPEPQCQPSSSPKIEFVLWSSIAQWGWGWLLHVGCPPSLRKWDTKNTWEVSRIYMSVSEDQRRWWGRVEGVFGGGCQTKGLRVRICGACSSTVLSSWMEVSKRPRWGWFWSQSRRGGEGGVASHHGAKTAFACWHYYYVSCCLKAWHYHLHLAHLTVSGGGTSFVNHSLGCPFWEKRSRVLSESRTSSKQLKGQSLTLCSVKQQRLHWSNKPE